MRVPVPRQPIHLAIVLSVAVVAQLMASSSPAHAGGSADADDPAAGKFTLEQATSGLSGPATAPLSATIETSKGTFTCTLYDRQAPNTVANFVGLARGVRPWKDPKTGKWVTKKPFYDGLTFHRVIPTFMIQGGDPEGTGRGGPGYAFADEISPNLRFDRPGLLAMANRGGGTATNGSQFFITEGMPSNLNGKHTIFGACEPLSLVAEIAHAPGTVIQKVTIARKSPAASPAAAGKVK
jgi:peptidyl-prolyl cis-trans isomerase A (cyclophilin A)